VRKDEAMSENIDKLWNALGALTFAETLEVAEVFRDAVESGSDFDPTDLHAWAFLLNTAREIAEDRQEV
jgi:hypothetical protein